MGHDTLTQPLLRNQARLTSGEIISRIDGKPLQCGGKECPWMTTQDTAQRSKDMKKLSRAVVFCVTFMILEVVGGIKAGSLAILTDAAHLLSDVASFAISLFAMWAGGWEANLRQTYGFFRLEILGALVSIQIIWLITGIIVYEAFVRLVRDPVEIDGRLMFIIASLGLIVNLIMMFMLGHDHGHGHGHDHGHSHGSNSKHSHGHKHSEDHHDHSSHSADHPHNHTEENHSHDHHDDEEHPSESHSHGELGSHHHTEDSQGHDHHDHGHQDKDDEVHDESNGSHTSTGLDPTAAAVLIESGHKTQCVQENISKSRRSKSGDTIIMCICDQLENMSESSSVRVTIDHGRNDDHDESSHGGSINVRGAYLHVLGDLIQSIGVMVGGAVIWYKPEWKIVDLICTFFFSIIVLITTIKMIRDILEVLMESTPREVDAGALQSGLMNIEGVIAVHELHIWAITVGKVVLACHVMIQPDADSDDLLEKVIQYCDRKFKISHVTIQIERLKR